MRTHLNTIALAILIATVAAYDIARSEESSKSDDEKAEKIAKEEVIHEQAFGKARVSRGMTKEEALKQIALSRSQYDPLINEQSNEVYVEQPTKDIVKNDTWILTCPSRNSKFLGGGGGIILKLKFSNNKISEMRRMPWVGA